jgi:hypothetical protein
MTQDECNELFYITDDFKLFRKTTIACNLKDGTEAGWLDGNYRRVRVNGKSQLVHRVIFLMLHGYLPEVVDHINGDTLNNHSDNLRDSDKKKNRWNSRGNKGTCTGVKGVYSDRGRYKALVTFKRDRYYLGMYSTIEEAAKVVEDKYKELQKEFSFHFRNNRGKDNNDPSKKG